MKQARVLVLPASIGKLRTGKKGFNAWKTLIAPGTKGIRLLRQFMPGSSCEVWARGTRRIILLQRSIHYAERKVGEAGPREYATLWRSGQHAVQYVCLLGVSFSIATSRWSRVQAPLSFCIVSLPAGRTASCVCSESKHKRRGN